jgi:uncharacterized protein
MIRRLLILFFLLVAAPAAAQDFPQLTGRVVDQANLLSPEQEQQLTQKLEALQRQSSRQFVVATIADLQGHDDSEYGYQLGRRWGIGQQGADNGLILLVAPNEHKVRVEVGRGLEGIITDALSHEIIDEQMVPRFKQNDYAGGINAGVDALIAQLQAPPEVREQNAAAAQQRANERTSRRHGNGATGAGIIIGLVILFLVLAAVFGRRGRGRRYASGGGSGLGEVLLWTALDIAMHSGSGGGGGSSWSGGGGDGGGGGGFSGGGGDFGGGGASGSW